MSNSLFKTKTPPTYPVRHRLSFFLPESNLCANKNLPTKGVKGTQSGDGSATWGRFSLVAPNSWQSATRENRPRVAENRPRYTPLQKPARVRAGFW